jgi:hypothetical protein
LLGFLVFLLRNVSAGKIVGGFHRFRFWAAICLPLRPSDRTCHVG